MEPKADFSQLRGGACHVLLSAARWNMGGIEIKEMSRSQIKRVFEGFDFQKVRNCGVKTEAEIWEWLNGVPPKRPRWSKRFKRFKLFGRRIQITLTVTKIE